MRSGPVLLYVLGIALFCVMDAVMKHLIASYPVVMVTWWRYIFAVGFTFAMWWAAGRPAITREMLPLHILRGSIIAVSAFTFFWSLTRLTLAEAVTFSFIAPLMVPPLASLLLNERMQAGNLAAAALGFAGVLVAVGFSPEALTPQRLEGIGAVLVGAVTYALATVLMRARAAKDGPAILSLLGAAVPTLVLAPFVLFGLPTGVQLPRTPPDLGWFVLAGLCGALALQLFARAYAQREAQELAPFEYTALAWAALLGWLFFSEPVSLRTWAGAALIIAACLWQARRLPADSPATPAA
jgi:S-adenosylmethionine uptake transporter